MKYIKSYKIFESSSEDLLGTINDIFISLDDSGIEWEMGNHPGSKNIGLVHIVIKGQNELINDCIDHLINYLKELGNEYFVGRAIKGETHISIENNFNKEIEKDFLKIIEGIREIEHDDYPNSLFWVIPDNDNYILFRQDKGDRLFCDFDKVYSFFKIGYSLRNNEIDGVVRYLVGKHLKLEALRTAYIYQKTFMEKEIHGKI